MLILLVLKQRYDVHLNDVKNDGIKIPGTMAVYFDELAIIMQKWQLNPRYWWYQFCEDQGFLYA